jgi:hypothetical protein
MGNSSQGTKDMPGFQSHRLKGHFSGKIGTQNNKTNIAGNPYNRL